MGLNDQQTLNKLIVVIDKILYIIKLIKNYSKSNTEERNTTMLIKIV